MNKKPISFIILKILGIGLLIMAIVGLVLSIRGFKDFESNDFMIGAALTAVGICFGSICISIGFRPETSRIMVKQTKYIQEENKNELKDIATMSADIQKEGIKTAAKAVKEGLTDKMYCKYCGAEIDSDSKFCKNCGKEL